MQQQNCTPKRSLACLCLPRYVVRWPILAESRATLTRTHSLNPNLQSCVVQIINRWAGSAFKSRFGKMGVPTAMGGKITRQSWWTLRPQCGYGNTESGLRRTRKAYRPAGEHPVPRDEGTVRLSAKAESDRTIRRSSVQI